jgi:hypothetical protein
MRIKIGKNKVSGKAKQTFVDGDQIGRDQYNVGAVPAEVERSLQSLIEEARRLLPADRSASVEAAVHGIEQDMSAANPDRETAASRLGSAVEVMKQGGAALEASSSIVQGIAKIAQWIGPVAGAVLARVGLVL